MTQLERAIVSLSDPSISLPDALRGLLVVSRRIAADDLSDWINHELNGFELDDDLPDYRLLEGVPIRVYFDGYGGRREEVDLPVSALPEALTSGLTTTPLRSPVAELAALSNSPGTPTFDLPPMWVEMYRHFAEKKEVPMYAMHFVNEAEIRIPSTHIQGILDRIRTTALELALSIEDVSIDAGSPGGPTVESTPEIARAINIHIGQFHAAAGANLAIAENAAIAAGNGSTVVLLQHGDLNGLVSSAGQYLGAEGVAAFQAALEEDGGQPGEETSGFLERVRAGFYELAVDVTASGAYEGLVALLAQVF